MLNRLLSFLLLFALVAPPIAAQRPDTCFTAQPIPDSIFHRMQGRSFPPGCPIRRADLRYLQVSYWAGRGDTIRLGQLVCHRTIAADLVSIFRQLWLARYPIERVQLIDDFDGDDERSMQANNTSCFNYRSVAGTSTLSKHARGLAIDINPLYNPCVRNGRVQPSQGRKWATRRAGRNDIPYKIDHADLCYRLFRQHGFRWGGDWRSLKDYQHFEK